MLTLHFENASGEAGVPDESDVHRWLSYTLNDYPRDFEICVRLVSREESARLNSDYRGKTNATNVLSFPADLPEEISPLIGDLAICVPVVAEEAKQQHKPLTAHWAHMLIHGCLHLMGYDHIEPAQASQMEQLETRILADLGFPDPYQTETLFASGQQQ